MPDGTLTSRKTHLQVGDEVLVGRKPTGTLVLSDQLPGRFLYLFATGTGLAPFMSIVRDPDVYERFDKVVLVHGVRQASELAYADVIERELPRDEFLGAGDQGEADLFPDRHARVVPQPGSLAGADRERRAVPRDRSGANRRFGGPGHDLRRRGHAERHPGHARQARLRSVALHRSRRPLRDRKGLRRQVKRRASSTVRNCASLEISARMFLRRARRRRLVVEQAKRRSPVKLNRPITGADAGQRAAGGPPSAAVLLAWHAEWREGHGRQCSKRCSRSVTSAPGATPG